MTYKRDTFVQRQKCPEKSKGKHTGSTPSISQGPVKPSETIQEHETNSSPQFLPQKETTLHCQHLSLDLELLTL
jgi:hypothetical protein